VLMSAGAKSIYDLILIMPTAARLNPSSIKNKLKREEVFQKTKKAHGRQKLQKRLAQAKAEANDPAAKKVGLRQCSSSQETRSSDWHPERNAWRKTSLVHSIICVNLIPLRSCLIPPDPSPLLVNLTKPRLIWNTTTSHLTSLKLLTPPSHQKFSSQPQRKQRKPPMISAMNLSGYFLAQSSLKERRGKGSRWGRLPVGPLSGDTSMCA
jgi:hypothetical protein